LSVNLGELKSCLSLNILVTDIKFVLVQRFESLFRSPKIEKSERNLGHFKNNQWADVIKIVECLSHWLGFMGQTSNGLPTEGSNTK